LRDGTFVHRVGFKNPDSERDKLRRIPQRTAIFSCIFVWQLLFFNFMAVFTFGEVLM
jgi:hypothetical protein